MPLKVKKPIHHSKPKTAPKLNVAGLHSEEMSQQLATNLSNARIEKAVGDNVETTWSKHKDLTLKIATATLGPVIELNAHTGIGLMRTMILFNLS